MMIFFFEILSTLLSCQQGNPEWENSKPHGIFFESPFLFSVEFVCSQDKRWVFLKISFVVLYPILKHLGHNNLIEYL